MTNSPKRSRLFSDFRNSEPVSWNLTNGYILIILFIIWNASSISASSFIFTIQSENLMYPSNAKLVFPNFTGSGFLTFSYCQSGYSTLDFLVGKQKVINLTSGIADARICEWKYATIPVNSTKQQVSKASYDLTITIFLICTQDLIWQFIVPMLFFLLRYAWRDQAQIMIQELLLWMTFFLSIIMVSN